MGRGEDNAANVDNSLTRLSRQGHFEVRSVPSSHPRLANSKYFADEKYFDSCNEIREGECDRSINSLSGAHRNEHRRVDQGKLIRTGTP